MTALPDWTLIRSFLAVLRRGSLSAAARATGLTQPTIGRHVAELEQELKLALFTRSPSGLLPTEAARGLAIHAEAMEEAFAALVRAADAGTDASSPTGTVRISASEIMGLAVLPPILAGLRFAHPGITLELVLNNRADDLLRRTADIAVRMVRPTQDGLTARRIGALELGLYAHRRYVERFGLPARLEDLPDYHIIGFDRDDHSARAVAAGKLPIARELFAFRSDQDAAQLAALRAGLGIGVIQLGIARAEPDLVPILPDQLMLVLDCWLAVHSDQKDQPAIRACFDHLAEGLSAWVEAARAPA